MGMTVGENKGVAAEPNVVPLIDVLLVLIIIFMVIMPSDSKGLPTQVPQPAPPQARNDPEPATIVVQVKTGGKLLINRDASDWNRLGPQLAKIYAARADKTGFVEGDKDVDFDEVARAIDIMRGVGIEHVGLLTAGVEAPARRL